MFLRRGEGYGSGPPQEIAPEAGAVTHLSHHWCSRLLRYCTTPPSRNSWIRPWDGIKIKRYCGCIGASPLSQFDFFSLPMIKLWDISLDCPARKQVPFVRQPFNLSSFRAISGHTIFYGSRSDSLKFSVSLSAWKAAEVSSHNFQVKSVCFERLIKSLDSVFGNAWQNPINWPLHDIEWSRHRTPHLLFRREQNISFFPYKQGTDARRLHYFYGSLFWNKE